MKKIRLFLWTIAAGASFNAAAQSGINTTSPKATMDITAKNATGTTTNVDGLLIPRVDRQRAQSMSSVPTSTMIYIDNVATGTATGTTASVDAVGYYYYNGTAWIKVARNSLVSAARATGSLTMTANNTNYNTNATVAPTETFDNLNEFSGNSFTAAATGLYQVDFAMACPQSSVAGSDGYQPVLIINVNGTQYNLSRHKVAVFEAGGVANFNNVYDRQLVRLNSGDALTFVARAYGASAEIGTTGLTFSYIISVVRVD